MNTCGVIFPRNHPCGPFDNDGCRLKHGHDGRHEFVDKNGKIIEWETDFECNCADCQNEDANFWCIVYQEKE